MKRIAMYPGSFDPITNGHVDIIERGLKAFDEIAVVIATNPRKQDSASALFSVAERVQLIEEVFANEPRITVDVSTGLIMDYAREKQICAVLRGLRAAGDFENEFMMASMNRGLNPDVDTFFMVTGHDWFFISSSILKEVFQFGGSVAEYVPEPVLRALSQKIKLEE